MADGSSDANVPLTGARASILAIVSVLVLLVAIYVEHTVLVIISFAVLVGCFLFLLYDFVTHRRSSRDSRAG